MRFVRLALAAVAACAPLLATAGAVDAFLAFTASTRSATARFEQQVLDPAGRQVDKATGSFAFSRPGRFRWAYDRPVRSLIVADGEKLWIHDEDLNQVVVRSMGRALSATPAALLAGREDVTAVFTLREAGDADGLAWLEAVPKERDTGFESIRIGMRGTLPAAMELHDALGGRTRLRFADFRPNAAIAADAFRFVPPKGADVLDEIPAARPAGPRGTSPGKP